MHCALRRSEQYLVIDWFEVGRTVLVISHLHTAQLHTLDCISVVAKGDVQAVLPLASVFV